MLVSYGADINYIANSGASILCMAAESGNLELVKYLWAQGAKINEGKGETTPLIRATNKNHLEIVKFFLSKGVSVNQTDDREETALHQACKYGLIEMTMLLLEKGADPNRVNQNGDTPLVDAAIRGSVEIIRLLISHGAELFSEHNAGYRALSSAVSFAHINVVSLLLEAHVPVEPGRTKKNVAFLARAAKQIRLKTIPIRILELLLKYGASLHATDKKGNDALMLAANAKDIAAVNFLLKNGAVIGQINSNGQHALNIASSRLDISATKLNLKTNRDIEILIQLLIRAQTQANWLQLRTDTINKAKNPLTREIILQSLAWPHVYDKLTLANLAKNVLNRNELKNYIQFAITASPTNLSDQTITYMLSLAGICPSLIEHIRPYIQAIPQIKSQLFGNSTIIHPSIVDSFIAGMSLTLERIRIEHGEHWKPYDGELSGSPVFQFFNQVANTELNQLIEHAANHETTNTALVFENLLEACFNSTFTAQTLPHSFPPYTAATGALTNALMAKGVYSAFATKIEAAWKATWSHFVGKPMISDSGSSSSSSSSSFSSSMSSLAQNAVYDPDHPFGVNDYGSTDEWIDQLSVPAGPVNYLYSPQGQDLLEAFRTQLRLAFDQVGENILDLPKGEAEASAEAAKIYSELMFRQLHMLKQFIDPDPPK